MEGRPAEPIMMLHFDVNKTILMEDTTQSLTPEHIIKQQLAALAKGFLKEQDSSTPVAGVTQPPAWVWDGVLPCSALKTQGSAPADDDRLTYLQYCKQYVPRKERWQKSMAFTDPGEAGEALRGWAEELEGRLRLPPELVGTPAARAAGLEGPHGRLVPAFFRLLQHLQAGGRRYGLVLRTFGEDLPRVTAELNAFFRGEHPMHAGAGAQEGRCAAAERSGLLVRSDQGEVLVLGCPPAPPPAWDAWARNAKLTEDERDTESFHSGPMGARQPPPGTGQASHGKGAPSLATQHHAPEEGQWTVHTGPEAIYQVWCHLSRSGQTMCVRDDWSWWHKHGMRACTGKPIFVDPRDASIHPIFFDDHITEVERPTGRDHVSLPEDHKCIVDFRDNTGAPAAVPRAAHLHRVEPLQVLHDEEYFVRALQECERARGSWRNAAQRNAAQVGQPRARRMGLDLMLKAACLLPRLLGTAWRCTVGLVFGIRSQP